MAKARRAIRENLPLVDGVVVLLDARVPRSSCNPELSALMGEKPYMMLLNKEDLADPALTSRWVEYYRALGHPALAANCKTGKGLQHFGETVREELLPALAEKRARSGQTGRPFRLMTVGIPNTGKSAFINRMSGARRAKTEDRPGVTREKQWIRAGKGLEFLDMPGVLWQRTDDPLATLRLALTGAVRDEVYDTEGAAAALLEMMQRLYPAALAERYGEEVSAPAQGWELLEAAGRRRGMLLRGGEADTARAARAVLEDFRSGRLGRVTLDRPEEAA